MSQNGAKNMKVIKERNKEVSSGHNANYILDDLAEIRQETTVWGN
jgi:hypothetical protein